MIGQPVRGSRPMQRITAPESGRWRSLELNAAFVRHWEWRSGKDRPRLKMMSIEITATQRSRESPYFGQSSGWCYTRPVRIDQKASHFDIDNMRKVKRLVSPNSAVWLVAAALLAAAWAVPVRAAAPAAPGIDVVVLLDDSGSMATCWPWAGPPRTQDCLGSQNPPSDPNDLRYSAARLLVQLANSEDRIAIVRFNAGTEGVIGQLQRAGNPGNRQGLLDAIKPPGEYLAAGGYTRLDLALSQAHKLLSATKDENRPQYVLMLTDGVPTQPAGVPGQERGVRQAMDALTQLDAQVLPIVLCNEKAGCPDDTFIRQTIGRAPVKAATAGDLLQRFSALFAEMEPGLQVLDQASGGKLEFNVRPEHGAQRLVVVTGKSDSLALKRDGSPQPVSSAYQDDNVLLNVIEGQGFEAGKWIVETSGPGGFAVVQTDTYPELLFPPASVAGSSVATRYVPAGKPLAILADVAGPGAGAPLYLADGTALKPYAPGERLLSAILPDAGQDFTLQAGDDRDPLQIVRHFPLEARTDLPLALAQTPAAAAPCSSQGACPLAAAFGPGVEVTGTQGMVYVTDDSDAGKLVYSAPMVCSGRACSDPAGRFERLDGHRYNIRYFLQARAGGLRFGDWAETTLATAPAVGLRGLPSILDLKSQPIGGWPVTVTVGTTDDLGQLLATIALTRTDDGKAVPETQVSFDAGLASDGETAALLKVSTPPGLRPGHYEGRIEFEADRAPTDSRVVLPEPVPVTLTLARPAGRVLDASVDFGSVLFDTSPNFRVNPTVDVAVAFSEAPFAVVPTLVDSDCPELAISAGQPVAQGDAYRIPLTLTSSRAIAPRTCSGNLALAGPSEDYEVQGAQTIPWRVVVPEVEWQIVGVERAGRQASDLAFGSMGRPGERGGAVLLVRYNGQPPFSLALEDIEGESAVGKLAVGAQDVELVTGEITPQAGTAGLFRVPVEFIARRPLPQAGAAAAWLAGTDFTGQLRLAIAGLPDGQARDAAFRFHNPSVYQRYVAPIYAWWWPGLVTCPLSILLPMALVGFLLLRKKYADVERLLDEDRSAGFPGAPSAGHEPSGHPTDIPSVAPVHSLGAGPAYMLYGRPTAKSYDVPQRPPRSSATPEQGGPPAAVPASRQPLPAPRPAAAPASLPQRPSRPSGLRKSK